MKRIYGVFRSCVLSSVRDMTGVFWTLVFPLVLLSILVLIFGNLEEGGAIHFRTAVVNFDPTEEGFGSIVTEVFSEIASEPGSWLTLHLPEAGEDLQQFYQTQKHALESGRLEALLVLPEGFHTQVMGGVGGRFFGRYPDPVPIQVFGRANSLSSEAALGALAQVMEAINREIYLRSGLVDPQQLIQVTHIKVDGVGGRPFRFVDYILPGIILMAFLSSGLTGLVEDLAGRRDRGILRRYFVTPLRPGEYMAGLIGHILVLSVVQVILVQLVGWKVFGARLLLFTPQAIFWMVFSLVVILCFALLVVALAKTAGAAGSLLNILFYPMMFLGGLYFPVGEMPSILAAFVAINPITYLVNGFREALGVFPSPTSAELNLLVPTLWLLVSLGWGLRKFRWEVR